MSQETPRPLVRPGLAAAAFCAWLIAASGAAAQAVPQRDLLNAELWMQTAIEYRANCLGEYALAKIRLDQALHDRNWTAYDQKGAYRQMPPAVILDLDETALDNSAYEAGLVVSGTGFNPKTWDSWVKAEQARAVPGVLAFTRYAAARGVKVFYVTNRNAEQKAATLHNLQKLGFPMGGNVDTLLVKNGRPEWTGDAKGGRFAYIAQHYRVLLMFGDQMGDFTDKYSGTIAQRQQAFEQLEAHFGHDWIALPNPTYGSWESAAYDHDFRLSDEVKRAKKISALQPWPTPPQHPAQAASDAGAAGSPPSIARPSPTNK